MRPVVETVEVIAAATIMVKWRDSVQPSTVRLDGWIRSGGTQRAGLLRPECFRKLLVSQFGNAILWEGCEGAVMTALLLWHLAEEQRPFTGEDARAWQARTKLTNDEVADLFGISIRTWRSYRRGGRVPRSVAMACRAMSRDPLPLQAHLHCPRHLRIYADPLAED